MSDQNTERPLSYQEVKMAHMLASKESPEFAGMDVRGFAKWMNEKTGTGMYSAGDLGTPGRIAQEWNASVMQGLHDSGVPQVTRKVGEGLGSLVGGEWGRKTGGQFGEDLPRM